MKRGDLVKIIPDGRHGIIVDFDEDNDPIVYVSHSDCDFIRTFCGYKEPHYRQHLEVLNEKR